MNYYYIWFILFVIVAYLIITDNTIAIAFNYVMRLIRFDFEKIKWWIQHSPDNLIVRWLIHRRSMKMAKELMKEFEENKKK
jgi:uncharacterized Rossmann fold enzyme